MVAATAAGHHRRRSRAFSIESASTYDHVDLPSSEPPSPGQNQQNQQYYQFAGGRPEMAQRLSSSFQPYRDNENEETLFLPAGAAPYQAYANSGAYASHSRQPSGAEYVQPALMHSGHGSHSTGHASSPSGQSEHLYDSRSSQSHGHGGGSGSGSGAMGNAAGYAAAAYGGMQARSGPSSASTHHTGMSTHEGAGHNAAAGYKDPYNREYYDAPASQQQLAARPHGDPFGEDDYPMPRSPALQPAPLHRRRTTDPFGVKHSLRVINPDDASGHAGPTPRASVRERDSVASGLRRPESQSSMLEDFHYDDTAQNYLGYDGSHDAEGLGVKGRSRPGPLNLADGRTSALGGDDNSVYTPNEVNDVKFFRDD